MKKKNQNDPLVSDSDTISNKIERLLLKYSDQSRLSSLPNKHYENCLLFDPARDAFGCRIKPYGSVPDLKVRRTAYYTDHWKDVIEITNALKELNGFLVSLVGTDISQIEGVVCGVLLFKQNCANAIIDACKYYGVDQRPIEKIQSEMTVACNCDPLCGVRHRENGKPFMTGERDALERVSLEAYATIDSMLREIARVSGKGQEANTSGAAADERPESAEKTIIKGNPETEKKEASRIPLEFGDNENVTARQKKIIEILYHQPGGELKELTEKLVQRLQRKLKPETVRKDIRAINTIKPIIKNDRKGYGGYYRTDAPPKEN